MTDLLSQGDTAPGAADSAGRPGHATPPVLEVEGLSISFEQYTTGLHRRVLTVVSGLDASVRAGEMLAIVGSSGSGKSLLAHAILGILPSNASVSGSMRFKGEPLTRALQERLCGTEMALVPQSVGYLDPLMRVGRQVRSGVRSGDPAEVQRRVFARYALGPEVDDLYPFQLSGGMARRVLVATAVVAEASLVIADEPTPGLDPPAVAEALGHLRQLADSGAAVMLITHDIEAATSVADRIAVFYSGTTMEIAPAADFVTGGDALRHPYSRALWNALPVNGFEVTAGSQPAADEGVDGCPYHPRCRSRTDECLGALPALRAIRGGEARCVHAA